MNILSLILHSPFFATILYLVIFAAFTVMYHRSMKHSKIAEHDQRVWSRVFVMIVVFWFATLFAVFWHLCSAHGGLPFL